MLDNLSADFGVSAENIFLGGFSQWMIALSAGLAIPGLWAVFLPVWWLADPAAIHYTGK